MTGFGVEHFLHSFIISDPASSFKQQAVSGLFDLSLVSLAGVLKGYGGIFCPPHSSWRSWRPDIQTFVE
jgi:hypothetical protein